MASLEEIASRFPKAIEELQRSNERAAEDARVNQNRELEDLRKSVRESTDRRTREHKDNVQKLARMNEDIREAAKKEEELSKTSAGQAMALKKELESQGKIAEDNKEFQKLSYQARKEDYAQRLADATSPAAKKEIREEARADAKKNGSRLDKIAAGIGGLFEMGKKGLKTAALGGLAILSTLAIGAFVIALGKFLQSDSFKKMTKFISEVILPKLMKFWEFLKNNWEEIAVLIAGIITVLAITEFVEIATRVKNAFIAVKVFMLETMLPAVKGMIGGVVGTFVSIAGKIAAAFSAVVAFMTTTMLPAITAFMTPLLPFIAIAAAVSLVLYALWEAFQDFRKTLEETGSIGEAIKVAIGKFVGVLLGAIPALFLKLVAFVADLFGFKEFAKKVGDIDPIQFIADSVTSLIDSVVDFFKMLFNFDFSGFAKSLIPDFVSDTLGIGGSDESPEVASANRVKKLQQEKEDLTKRTNAKANTPRARQLARRQEILDKMIAREKASAAASLAKPMVLPKTQLSASETLEAQRLSPSQYKQSGSIQEKMEKSKQQAELARQQSAAAGPTIITDARRSSSVTTTGQTTGVIMPNKYGKLNMSDTGY
jgi:hypothetical protein